MKKTALAIFIFAFVLVGCNGESNKSADKTANKKEAAGVRVGTLAKEVMQHPLIAPPGFSQFYFDIKGTSRQIIVVFKEGMQIPTDPGKTVKLKGKIGRVSLGGKRGTPQSYSNETLTLESWQYTK